MGPDWLGPKTAASLSLPASLPAVPLLAVAPAAPALTAVLPAAAAPAPGALAAAPLRALPAVPVAAPAAAPSPAPAARRHGRLRSIWGAIAGIPEKLRRVRAYAARVRELTDGITADQLRWSLNRLKALETQEGILRADNCALVNPWEKAAAGVRALSPAEHDRVSLSRESLMKIFKTAMDLEEPPLQERVLAVALRGKPAPISI